MIVVEENHGYSSIIGSASAPYINSLAQQGVLFTDSFAIEHPSQPNYLDLFSGSNQNVLDDNVPSALFTTPNLGAALIANGLTFTGYSEDLPAVGFEGETSGAYARRHVPWTNWQDSAGNSIPAQDNAPFSAFPTDYSQLPTVSFVIPNVNDDMHDGSVAQGDTWLMQNLNGYLQWAQTHNSLLIVTFDEDDYLGTNQIATIFCGPMAVPGTYSARIDHFTVLRTIEDMYGLSYSGAAANAAPILGIWTPPLSAASAPSATPNPAGVGQPVTFAAATTGGVGTVAYAWDFGDGSPGAAGAAVAHGYASAGIFTATVIVTDTANGNVTASVAVTVNAPVVGTGDDSDGDGFSDSFEIAVGTDPYNAASTPTGSAITARTVQPLTISAAAIRLNFAKANADSIAFSGTVAVPAGFDRGTAKTYCDVGGVLKSVALNARGNDSVEVCFKSRHGVVQADAAARYRVKFKKGSFAATLDGLGLTNADATGATVSVPFTFIFNDTVYQTMRTMSYTAKKGKSGAAK